MSKKSIFIYGPPGSGKSLNRFALGDFFELFARDEWKQGDKYETYDCLYLTQTRPIVPGHQIYTIEEALTLMNKRTNYSLEYLTRSAVTRSEKWQKGPISNWSLSDWGVALAGEVGEVCNVIKKLNRVRDGLTGNTKSEDELTEDLALELADVLAYLLLLAARANIPLENAYIHKFNMTSIKNNLSDRL